MKTITNIKKLLIISVVLLLSGFTEIFYAQNDSLNKEILVFFKTGIERTAKGKLKAHVVSPNAKGFFKRFNIAEEKISSAFPDFNEADTLKNSPEGQIIAMPNMAKIFRIVIPDGVSRETIIDSLKKLPGVLFAEPNGIAVPQVIPNDQYFSSQWSMQSGGGTGKIEAPEAWDIYKGSTSNIIGVVDWGVDGTHPDLSGKASGDAPSTVYHGTHVAGIAAAKTNNSTGISGVNWNSSILSKNIENSDDAGTYQKIVDAVNYSTNVVVLNNSWTLVTSQSNPSPRYSSTVRMAFAYAYKQNRTAVCANGNYQQSFPNQTYYPAGFGQGIIAVGATDNLDNAANFSQVSNSIDVSAPGVSILSTYRNGTNFFNPQGVLDRNYQYLSGTSMATPHVAGIASLLKGYNTNLYNDDIEHIIQLSCDKVSGMNNQNFTNEYGYGRVDAKRALDLLRSPYTLQQSTATGGTEVGSVGTYRTIIYGVPGLAPDIYIVRRHEIQKTVSFNGTQNVNVWGRGVATNGWSIESPNYGMGWCDVVPGTVTSTRATLRTYVYEVWNSAGYWVGWYPTTASNVTYAYTVHGIRTPLSASISGPSEIYHPAKGVPRQTYTWTAVVNGGTPPYTYSWSWDGTQVGTSSSYSVELGYDGFYPPVQHTLRLTVRDASVPQQSVTLSKNIIEHSAQDWGLFKEVAQTEGSGLPDKVTLKQNFPNPFNPETEIAFELPERSYVTITILDVLGQEIMKLENSQFDAGYYSKIWTGVDASGSRVSSGIYLYHFAAKGESGKVFTKVMKMIMLK